MPRPVLLGARPVRADRARSLAPVAAVALVLGVLAVLMAPTLLAPALAAGEDATISYVQPAGDGTVQVIVSLPPDADPDLDSVAVTIGGTAVEASAPSRARRCW